MAATVVGLVVVPHRHLGFRLHQFASFPSRNIPPIHASSFVLRILDRGNFERNIPGIIIPSRLSLCC